MAMSNKFKVWPADPHEKLVVFSDWPLAYRYLRLVHRAGHAYQFDFFPGSEETGPPRWDLKWWRK